MGKKVDGFTQAEIKERELFETYKEVLGIEHIQFSKIESKDRWDFKIYWRGKWWVGDIKVVNINSNQLYKRSLNNGIKHLIKKQKIESLFKIYQTEYIEIQDHYCGMSFGIIKEPLLPLFVYIFNDGVIAIWDLLNIGVKWDPINKQIIEENNFVDIVDKKTEMGDQTLVVNRYYKYLDIRKSQRFTLDGKLLPKIDKKDPNYFVN